VCLFTSSLPHSACSITRFSSGTAPASIAAPVPPKSSLEQSGGFLRQRRVPVDAQEQRCVEFVSPVTAPSRFSVSSNVTAKPTEVRRKVEFNFI